MSERVPDYIRLSDDEAPEAEWWYDRLTESMRYDGVLIAPDGGDLSFETFCRFIEGIVAEHVRSALVALAASRTPFDFTPTRPSLSPDSLRENLFWQSYFADMDGSWRDRLVREADRIDARCDQAAQEPT